MVSGLWSKPRAVRVFRMACLSRSSTMGLSLWVRGWWGGGVRKDSLEAGHPTSGWLVDGGLSTPSSVRGRQLEPRLQDHLEKPGH